MTGKPPTNTALMAELHEVKRMVRLLLDATGTHTREGSGGTKVKTRILKLDWKFVLGILGAASGIGFTYKIIAPAVWVALVSIHHGLVGAN